MARAARSTKRPAGILRRPKTRFIASWRLKTRFIAWRAGEPIVTDGEQRESSFASYNLTDTLAGTGLADGLARDGQFFAIFDGGHNGHLQRTVNGLFRYKT
jgi:hypothetical protein